MIRRLSLQNAIASTTFVGLSAAIPDSLPSRRSVEFNVGDDRTFWKLLRCGYCMVSSAGFLSITQLFRACPMSTVIGSALFR